MFYFQEIDVGLAADIGTLARIPKITGNQSAVRELAYTARNFGPQEAEQLGFISRVIKGGRDEVINSALETAALIASKSPIAILGTKHLLLHARDHRWRDFLDNFLIWHSFRFQCTTESRIHSYLEWCQPTDFGEAFVLIYLKS